MRVSISITDVSGTGPAGLAGHLADTARAADEAGLDTVWVADHLLQAVPGTAVDDPVLEAYTTLGFLAAHTRRVRLGTLVTAVTFRPPALLIKAVTRLGVLSGGRTWLGVGAGHHLEEAEAMGLPLPPTPERFAHLEDTLRATCSTSPTAGPPCAASWTSSPGTARRSTGPSTRSPRPSARACTPTSPPSGSSTGAPRSPTSGSTTPSCSPPVPGPPPGWTPSPAPRPTSPT